jgi:adenylate kinase
MIERGELVSDDIVIALVNKELSSLDGRGWLLDGFPRTLPQARALDRFLGDRHESLDAVILIRVDGEEIVSRLNDRRICRKCGASYHLRFRPPATPGRCDTCGGELYQRSDDQPATIRKRLAVYETETRPLIEYYAASGNLVCVDGNQEIEAVMDEMKTSLERYLAGRS